jgi:hypothetical protein
MEITADFNDIFGNPPETEFQALLDFESEVSREAPYNDIAELTKSLKLSFLDYVRQGIMLHTVRRYRLYKQQYCDFAAYCKLALGRSHFYCKKIIQAAQVCLELIKSKFEILPTSVSQALPLVKFAKVDKYGDSQLEDKWQTVLDEFPDHQITAAKIQETLDENPEDRAKQIRVSGKSYQILEQKAAAAGMAVSKYLELLIDGTEPPDNEYCGEGEGEGEELTPEKEEILDDLEKFWSQTKLAGFGNKNPSKEPQTVINPTIRSDKVSESS